MGKDYQPVSTQLCVALADLYLQVPEWNNFIAELLSKFAELVLFQVAKIKKKFRLAQKEVKYSHVLLELLKVFPEELQNRSLRIGDNRRNSVQLELAAQTESVLAFLVCYKIRNFYATEFFRSTFVKVMKVVFNQKQFLRLVHG